MLPLDNPVYGALCALAPPEDWASVRPSAQPRPNRLRVVLKLHHTAQAHTLELKLRSENEVNEVWAEFDRWFAGFTSVG
jgi:hypothetical protein